MGLLQELYSQFSPMAQALLNADGSIQDFDGNQIEPPDEGRAILYTKYSPFANKIINPDGSVTTILRITADAPIDGNNQMASSCIPWSQTGNKRCGIIERKK